MVQIPTEAAVTVHRAYTEVWFETDADIEAVLWSGKLSWHLRQTTMPLGLLSAQEVGVAELAHNQLQAPPSATKDPVEQFAAKVEWLSFVQEMRLAGLRVFRGSILLNMPCSFSRFAQAALQLSFDDAVELQRPVRIRVTLRGQYSSQIEIG